jgi:hypothetical protein
MDAMGESPMLSHGYAKVALWSWLIWLMLASMLFWSAVCNIVGKDVPNVPMAVVGNEMLDDSISLAVENCCCISLSELLWLSAGNPHDIAVKDAWDSSAVRAMSKQIRAAMTILFIMILPSSILVVLSTLANTLGCVTTAIVRYPGIFYTG